MFETPSIDARPAPSGANIDGAQVRERRVLSGRTIANLAESCGITFQYLSMIERGDRQVVSAPVFARICDALGVTDRRALLRKAAS